LCQIASNSADRLALTVQADKAVSFEMQFRLWLLARDAGFSEVWLAALPSPSSPPARSSLP
jgi:biopolymer transport protein ExbD